MKLNIFIDGGSRGNPGRGACAAVLLDAKGAVVKEEGKYLGHCTNNFAEYNGLLLALSAAAKLGAAELRLCYDITDTHKCLLVYQKFYYLSIPPITLLIYKTSMTCFVN